MPIKLALDLGRVFCIALWLIIWANLYFDWVSRGFAVILSIIALVGWLIAMVVERNYYDRVSKMSDIS